MSVTISPPNAILFVLDPSSGNILVPTYVNGQLTAANPTCVSVGTQADVDGETEVSLLRQNSGDGRVYAGLHQVFQGEIQTPGNQIAIITSDAAVVASESVNGQVTQVAIFADDQRNPSRIAVVVEFTGGVRAIHPS